MKQYIRYCGKLYRAVDAWYEDYDRDDFEAMSDKTQTTFERRIEPKKFSAKGKDGKAAANALLAAVKKEALNQARIAAQAGKPLMAAPRLEEFVYAPQTAERGKIKGIVEFPFRLEGDYLSANIEWRVDLAIRGKEWVAEAKYGAHVSSWDMG